jgi:hypothetical protein
LPWTRRYPDNPFQNDHPQGIRPLLVVVGVLALLLVARHRVLLDVFPSFFGPLNPKKQ